MALKDFYPEEKNNKKGLMYKTDTQNPGIAVKNTYVVPEQTSQSVPKPSYLDKPAAVRQDYDPTPTAQNPYGTINPNNIYAGAFDKVNQMNKNAFDSYSKSRNAYADAAGVRLEGQKRNIYKDFNQNAKAAEGVRDAALDKLPEDMSGLGLYGQGVGETAIGNIRSAYSKQLTELMKQRDNNIYDIDNQITALKEQAAADIYNYEAQLMAQNPQLYLQLLEAENNENWREKEWDHNIERENIADNRYNTEWAYSTGKDEKEWNYMVGKDEKESADADTNAMAQFIATHGFVPQGMFSSSKLTESDINSLLGVYQRNLYSSGSSGSSGGGGSSSSGMNTEQNKLLADSMISKQIYSVYDIGSSDSYYDESITDNSTANQLIVAFKKVYNDGAAIKQYLADNGYTASQAENKLKEYQNNVFRKMQENGLVKAIYGSDRKNNTEAMLAATKKKYL